MQTQDLWPSFKNYVQQPYQRSAYLPDIMAWYDALYQRQESGEDLRLSFVEVRNEIIGRKFEGFCLNEQMYFSYDPAVLRLPQPSSTLDASDTVPSDQLIGIWLHDYRESEHFLHFCEDRVRLLGSGGARDTIKEKRWEHLYANHFYSDIMQVLNFSQTLSMAELAELKLAREKPIGFNWHRDTAGYQEYKAVQTIIAPVMRSGTVFSLDGIARVPEDAEPRNTVSCPVGATSSHFGCAYDEKSNPEMELWGARHKAQGHPDGRAVLLMDLRYMEPFKNEPTPWKISCLALGI